MDNNKSNIVTTNIETIDGKLVDWRLTGQGKYMMGIALKKVNIKNYLSQKHINEELWHEHCEFCMEKINSQYQEDCYTSKDYYNWICHNCFEDFKEYFHWSVEEPNKKI